MKNTNQKLLRYTAEVGGLSISTANILFQEGTFSAMYKAGFITAKVFLYREIYLWIQAQLKTRNVSKNKAVVEASVKFNKDERTIWRALNSFEEK